MLRIAIPNKGALAVAASEMLREAGYSQRADPKQLTRSDPDNDVEFFYLRPRDIALYVGEGTLDLGITGRDLLLDSGAKAEEVLRLCGPDAEVVEKLDVRGRRTLVYRGRRVVPQPRRRFGWLSTVSRWDVEDHEVQIDLAGELVTDVKAQVRRARLERADAA